MTRRRCVAPTLFTLFTSFALIGLVATACASASDDVATEVPAPAATVAPDPTAAPVPTSTPAPAPTVAPEPTPTATTSETTSATTQPAEQQLDWFVNQLNRDDIPTVAEVEAQFAPEFLEVVSAADLIAQTPQIFAAGTAPFVVTEFTPADDAGLAGTATIESANGAQFMVDISVGSTPPHRINGLFVQPGEGAEIPEFKSDITIEELDNNLSETAEMSSIGVYDVSDGTCQAVHELRGDQPVVLGSVFKLWVLAELAEQVAAGDAAWDEPLPVMDGLRSSPDGEIFFVESGETRTLREYAELMISISDNSATDHLIARLGRENIEAMIGQIGVSAAGANVPLLSTGNMFQLKFAPSAPNAADYRDLDDAAQRALLESIDGEGPPWGSIEDVDLANANGVSVSEPRDLDIEWFATPGDLCRTLVHLGALAETPGLEPVADVLEMNPGAGIPFDRERWPTIRFKGGSEPGVLAGAWWFEGSDGERVVVAGGLSDGSEAFDDAAAIFLLASAINLIE